MAVLDASRCSTLLFALPTQVEAMPAPHARSPGGRGSASGASKGEDLFTTSRKPPPVLSTAPLRRRCQTAPDVGGAFERTKDEGRRLRGRIGRWSCIGRYTARLWGRLCGAPAANKARRGPQKDRRQNGPNGPNGPTLHLAVFSATRPGLCSGDGVMTARAPEAAGLLTRRGGPGQIEGSSGTPRHHFEGPRKDPFEDRLEDRPGAVFRPSWAVSRGRFMTVGFDSRPSSSRPDRLKDRLEAILGPS
mmetsp:Transcript_12819/g.45207  ORF Transcript_12819/g.45207 Transcript_12819/m.45207 type:complete len:247 (+) Transcript_12819:206-946(+)